jgi:prepilin-type N-terminal cleavage/methylation domain-containing protein
VIAFKRNSQNVVASRRAGFTMLEVLCVLSASSIILVLSASWIHQTMKFSRQIKETQQHHSRLLQLGSTFRSDVRLATKVSLDEKNVLTLRMENSTSVSYTIGDDKHSLVRVLTTAETKKPKVHSDYFLLSPRSTIEWDQAEFPDWIGIVVNRIKVPLKLQRPNPKIIAAMNTDEFGRPIQKKDKSVQESSQLKNDVPENNLPEINSPVFDDPTADQKLGVDFHIRAKVNRWGDADE